VLEVFRATSFLVMLRKLALLMLVISARAFRPAPLRRVGTPVHAARVQARPFVL
jgi:hypothetical protein